MSAARRVCTKRLVGAWVLGLASSSCGQRTGPPAGQVLLYFDTDAILPEPTLGNAPGTVPLFDRLLVEVFEPGAADPCNNCSRVFALDADSMRAGTVSIGVPTPADTPGYRVRASLYWSAGALTGLPTPQASVQVVARLPTVGVDGIVPQTLLLSTDTVGQPSGTLDAPVDTLAGPPGPSAVGTWPRATPVPCASAPKAGQVCVPGGTFWMGNPKAPPTSIGNDVDETRLVVLSPFFMDAAEVTVKELRDAGGMAYPWSGMAGGNVLDWCTFTIAPGPNEDLPVNCVDWVAARTSCELKGGDLPSEAQFEFASGTLTSNLFVWGSDPPTCSDAVLARGNYAFNASIQACNPTGTQRVYPLAAGQSSRDRLTLETGTIVDLAGNVAELTRDQWNRQTDPCWSAGMLYVDPVCNRASLADPRAVPTVPEHTEKGGGFLTAFSSAPAAHKRLALADGSSPEVGFRCVYPGAL